MNRAGSAQKFDASQMYIILLSISAIEYTHDYWALDFSQIDQNFSRPSNAVLASHFTNSSDGASAPMRLHQNREGCQVSS